MYKLVKKLLVISLVISFAACGQSNSNTTDTNTSSPTVVNKKAGASFSEIEMNSVEQQAVGHFGFGQNASAEEIAGWDIDIRPDGMGLPEGSGNVEDGEMLYEAQCSSCHGSFGEGANGYPKLAGGEDSLQEARPEKTVGSFWPYASTLWDYIHRAMPFQAPESLEDDEVYALTAYVLYLNDLVEDDFELTRENFTDIEMPNKDGFYRDDRPDVLGKRCMENCKDYEIEITSEPMNATYFTGDNAKVVASVPKEEFANTESVGKETYQAACTMCHASGVAGAPVTGAKDQWTERLSKGQAELTKSAINGIGAMPAKGGQSQLSDEDVVAAVAYMLLETQ